MSQEFIALLEDPAADLNGEQIKEYGLAKVWHARIALEVGDHLPAIELHETWLADSRREFPKWILSHWYRQRRARSGDPHQSPLALSSRDTEGMHGRITDHEELSDYYSRGGIRGILQAAGLSEIEMETMEMRLSGTEVREIARLRGIRHPAVIGAISRSTHKLQSRFGVTMNPLISETPVEEIT